jgi:hypothetical protein
LPAVQRFASRPRCRLCGVSIQVQAHCANRGRTDSLRPPPGNVVSIQKCVDAARAPWNTFSNADVAPPRKKKPAAFE